MDKFIVCCSCSGTREKMAQVFQSMFQEEEQPEIVAGTDRIRSKAEQYPNDSNIANHLRAIAKRNGNFGYYIVVDDEYNIAEMHDLVNKQRIY